MFRSNEQQNASCQLPIANFISEMNDLLGGITLTGAGYGFVYLKHTAFHILYHELQM